MSSFASGPLFGTSRPGIAHECADVLILGAGLAGTSLAHHLEAVGFDGRVLLLDQRHDFSTEARWCTWSNIPDGMKSLITNEWNRWSVLDENQIINVKASGYAYREIHAPSFFHHFHKQWSNAWLPQNPTAIELRLGWNVQSVSRHSGGLVVNANDALGRTTQLHARWVFDARHMGSGRLNNLSQPGELHWRQSFVGRIVEFERPVFEPETATMMDFRLPQVANAQGVRFCYLLPSSPYRALVECTSFAPHAVPQCELTSLLTDYLHCHYGTGFRILGQEEGDLPMATTPLPVRLGENHGAIGVAGGACRAATGFAFPRIQRQTQIIAASLARGDDPFTALESRSKRWHATRFGWLDGVFLEALGQGPSFAHKCFTTLFKDVPPERLVRFLNEESSIIDESHVIAALPKLPLLGAATRRVRNHYDERRLPASRVPRLTRRACDAQYAEGNQ